MRKKTLIWFLALGILCAAILCVPLVLNKLHDRLSASEETPSARIGLHLFTQPEKQRSDFYQKEERKEILITDMTSAEELDVFEDGFSNPAYVSGMYYMRKGGLMKTAEAFFAKEAEYLLLNDAELGLLMREYGKGFYDKLTPVVTVKGELPVELPEGTENLYDHPFVIALTVYHGMDVLPEKNTNDANILIAVDPVLRKMLLISVPGKMIVHKEDGSEDLWKYQGLHGSASLLEMYRKTFGETAENLLSIDERTVYSFLLSMDEFLIDNPEEYVSPEGYVYPKGEIYLNADRVLPYLTEDTGVSRQVREIAAFQGFLKDLREYSRIYLFDNFIRNNPTRMITNLKTYEFFTLCQRIVNDEKEWSFETVILDGVPETILSGTMGTEVTGIRVSDNDLSAAAERIQQYMKR